MARNTNEVRLVSDLPKWFDISKYKTATALDKTNWYENLFVRGELLQVIDSIEFKKALKEGRQIAQSIYSDLETLRQAPIYSVSGLNKRKLWLLCRARQIRPEAGVRQMTVNDLYWAEKNIDEAKRNYARTIFSRTDDSESFYDALLWTKREEAWKVNPLGDVLSGGLLKVNLLLPENLLVEQFKAMLKNKKRSIRKVQSPEFDKWIKFGVLPYLDLKIWERESGKSITNRVMADAIFTPGEGGEEVVRKTTAKLADELLTIKHLETLAALAAHEIAERSVS